MKKNIPELWQFCSRVSALKNGKNIGNIFKDEVICHTDVCCFAIIASMPHSP
jgi:hypothetical protein